MQPDAGRLTEPAVPSRPEPPLFYVVDWLPPDFGAVGQYASQYASDMAWAGRRVCLIGLTSSTLRRTCFTFGRGTLETVRLPAASYDKSRFADRLLWTLGVGARLLWEVVRRRDSYRAELLFTGAPPFFLYFAVAAKLLRRVRLTYRTTDFYPEVLIAEFGDRHRLLSLLRRTTWLLRRYVDRFEALGLDQRRLLLEDGIAADRITVRRDASPVAVTGREPAAPRPSALANRKVLLYSGNCGVPHDVETVIAGLIRHHRQGSGRFGLWLNAMGRNADRLEAGLRAAGVPVARGRTVPLDQLAGVLRAADVHLVTLRPQFSGIVLPSKIYGCLASGRPILFVGPQSSDVHGLCLENASAGYQHVEPGDPVAFAAALERLADAGEPAPAAGRDSSGAIVPPSGDGGAKTISA
jgi:glycosyltransferase involved in cell wall biosynthesis